MIPYSDAWEGLSDLPAPRHHINLVGHGKRLYALGGYVAVDRIDAWIMQKQTWIYDAESEAWQEGRSAPGPHAETVCVSLGEHIHVTGGRVPRGDRNARWDDQTDTNQHLAYDPALDRWDRSAPALAARNSAAGAAIAVGTQPLTLDRGSVARRISKVVQSN